MKNLLNELQLLQNEAVQIVNQIPEEDYNKQFNSDLSPLGWHLGHCIFIELYWIREQCQQKPVDDSLKTLYFPELSHKPSRGAELPKKEELIKWANKTQAENFELLESILVDNPENSLLENNFLIHFLIQHYCQHIETMTMVLTERNLQGHYKDINTDVSKLKQSIKSEFIDITGGIYEVGSNNRELSYDNERPLHSVELESFSIGSLPVSNLEYKKFIDNECYLNKKYWSDKGWAWLQETKYKYPHHWINNNDSDFYCVNLNGVVPLEDHQPVYGVSYYEAEAYANWQSARLPHEHEWEVAALNNYLQATGTVWEWCHNTFYPYANFKPYPYMGYSVPYFDNKHYVLRGGGQYTKKRIKRPSFRNYYTADKRHNFAGLRLVKD